MELFRFQRCFQALKILCSCKIRDPPRRLSQGHVLFKSENRFRPCYFLHQKFDLHGKKYHWSANGRVQSVAVYPSHPLLCSSYQTQSLSSCEESVFKKSWKSWNLIQHQLQFPQKWSKKRNQKWKKMLSMQWFHINLKSYLCQTAIIVFIAFQSLII